MKPRYILLLGVLAHLLLQLGPIWPDVRDNRSGRDFASYYYALQATSHDMDPYNTGQLTQLAEADGTRHSVNPYFYPPPFLFTMVWASGLDLHAAYVGMLFVNELLLAACLGVMVLGFEVSLPVVALILAAWTPIPDHARMGQANLLALLPALLGLWAARRRESLGGALIGVAGMLKMSPALFLIHLAMQRRWKAVAAAVGTAVALSLAALPLVPLDQQIRFYTRILPGFGTGDYNGLTVPITLPANHSWPDLLNRAFPSGGDLLSPTAQALSNVSLLGSLALWAWWFRGPQPPRQEALALGALSLLMVALPVYTYEHHLVFLILMAGAVGTAATTVRRKILFGICFFFLAWPLDWLRAAQHVLPRFLNAPLRESKFMAEVGFLLLCARWYRQDQAASGAEAVPP